MKLLTSNNMKLGFCSIFKPALIILLVTATISTLHAETRYVKAGSSNPVPPYTSWETASDSIQKCINFSNEWDTVKLADGIYPELIDMKKGITLTGSGYNTIIGGKYLNGSTSRYYIILANDSVTISDLQIRGNTQFDAGIIGTYLFSRPFKDLRAENLFFDSLYFAFGFISSGTILNCSAKTKQFLHYFNPQWNSELQILNNRIITDLFFESYQTPIYPAGNSHVLIKDNIVVIDNGNTLRIFNDTQSPPNQVFDVYNNVFYMAGYQFDRKKLYSRYNFYNNTFDTRIKYKGSSVPQAAFELFGPTSFVNNIFSNITTVVQENSLLPERFQYNVVWNGYNQTFMDSTNLFTYPMIMGKSITLTNGNWPIVQGSKLNYDCRLQKHSPVINMGDPSILDVDESRSDPGAFGGPWGISYDYQDTAPQVPISGALLFNDATSNFTAYWEPTPDQDFWKYFYYIDTNRTHGNHNHFYTGETRDTIITVRVNKKKGGKWYAWVSAIDTAGNQSSWRPLVSYTITGIEDDYNTPVQHDITGIYPNPFNAEAKVEYVIGSKGSPIFRIYDINGALLQTIDKGEQEEGSYNITLNMPNFASGVYFIRLEVRDSYSGKLTQTQSKKIVMVK